MISFSTSQQQHPPPSLNNNNGADDEEEEEELPSSSLVVEEQEASTTNNRKKPVIVLSNSNNTPIYLTENWNYGIGGGLWSMGVALSKYFDSKHSQVVFTRKFECQEHIKVLELGSGNGFLSVSLLATLKQHFIINKDNNHNKITLHVTDTPEHLPLIESTLIANDYCRKKVISSEEDCNSKTSPYYYYVPEEEDKKGSSSSSSSSSPSTLMMPDDSNNIKVFVEEYVWGQTKYNDKQDYDFDLIIGSDLAYRDELHDILIESILDCSTTCGKKTITLLGITMNDTKPIFFEKLQHAGLQYERLADHLIDPEYRGSQFGIFLISEKIK